jgi:hypothetical protein
MYLIFSHASDPLLLFFCSFQNINIHSLKLIFIVLLEILISAQCFL